MSLQWLVGWLVGWHAQPKMLLLPCIDYATLIKRFIFYEQTFDMHVASFSDATISTKPLHVYYIIYQQAIHNVIAHRHSHTCNLQLSLPTINVEYLESARYMIFTECFIFLGYENVVAKIKFLCSSDKNILVSCIRLFLDLSEFLCLKTFC